MNPANLLYPYTGMQFCLTSRERICRDNCLALRQKLFEYVDDRISGKNKSKIGNGHDLLTLFLENPEIFTRDFIVDELLDFFVAAMVTTQAVTQTMVCSFCKDPSIVAKIRDEFEK